MVFETNWNTALTLFGFIFNMVINVLSSLGVFNNLTVSQVSAKYETVITPSGYAFSIWSVIFLLQGVYTLYIVLPIHYAQKYPYIQQFGLFLPGVFFLEGTWILAFVYEKIWLSLIIILAVWACIGVSYFRVFAWTISHDQSFLMRAFDYAIYYVPTALNFGWITAASLLNILIVLVWLKVRVGVALGVAFLCIAFVIALVILLVEKEPLFALTITWALVAIAVKHADISAIRYTAWTFASVLAVASVVVAINQYATRPPHAYTHSEL